MDGRNMAHEQSAVEQPPRLRVLSGPGMGLPPPARGGARPNPCEYRLPAPDVLMPGVGGACAGKGKTVALSDGRNEVGKALTCQVCIDKPETRNPKSSTKP